MKKRLISITCIVLCAVLMSTTAAFADTGLTVELRYGNVNFAGFTVSIWRVADLDLIATPAFAGAGIDWGKVLVDPEKDDGEANKATANTLYRFMTRNTIAPTNTVTADADGNAKFNSLEEGVYLVTTTDYRTRAQYVFTHFIILVMGEEDIIAIPKAEYVPPGGGGGGGRRPPGGGGGDDPGTDIPDPRPPLDPNGPPVTPPVVDIPEPPPPLDDLPQTGVLRWPVPVLAIFGFLLIMVGVLINRRDNKTHART